MKVHDLRYFAIEHTSTMLVALVLAHIGSIRSRKVSLPSRTAYLRAFRWHTASLVLILLGVPWWRLAIRQ
jgi:hypothetical protein